MDQEELSNRINILDDEIKRVNAKLEAKKPWYREVSSIVAVLALLFSFGTTMVSFSKAKDQEYIAARIELRSVMERLADIPRRHIEIFEKYNKDSTDLVTQLAVQLNTENLSLSNQAYAIIERIEGMKVGKGKILDIEYIAIANALSYSLQQEKARKLLEEGYRRSRDASTAAASLRSLATIALFFDDKDKARNYMKKARNIYDENKYKNDPDLNKKWINATTEIQWANMEFMLSNFAGSKKHLEECGKIINLISQPNVRSQIERQVIDLTNKLKAYQ